MNRLEKFQIGFLVAATLSMHLISNAVASPLPDHDNGPLTGIFGLPDSTEGSHVLARNQHSWETTLAISSHNIDESRAHEVLRFDGETTRLALSYRRGLSDDFDFSVELPYIWHESGNLDAAIDDWHNFFGLPNGPRKIRVQDRLEFFYRDSGANSLALTRNSNGLGDIRVTARWQAAKTSTYSSSINVGIKLPTGESDVLLGSGGTDLSLGMAGDVTDLWSKDKLSGFYRFNVTYLGTPDWLADRYNKFVGQLSFGLGYRVHHNLDLSVQSRIRSAIYDSDIKNLGATAVSLTFGASIRVAQQYRLVLSVGEDVLPDTAPDVSFQIALLYVK